MFDRLKAIVKRVVVGNSDFNSPSWRVSSGLAPIANEETATPAQLQSLSGVFRACSLFADSIAGLPVRVEQSEPGAGRVPVLRSRAARLLSGWSYESKELFLFASILGGNGYLRIHEDRLEAISPWRVGIERDDSGAVFYRLAQDQSLAQAEELLPESEIVHLKYRVDQRNPMFGTAPLASLAPALDSVWQTREAQRAVFRNVSSAGIVLTSPNPIAHAAASRLRDAWERGVAGRFRGKTVVLDNSIKAEALPIGELINLQLEQLSRFNVTEISRAYGVPPSLLGEVESVNYASSAELMRQFAQTSLAPYSRRVESALIEKLITPRDRANNIGIRFDLQPVTLGAGIERIEFFSKAVNSGLMNTDECRDMLGLSSVPDGATLRIATNVMPMQHWSDYSPGAGSQAPTKSVTRIRELTHSEPRSDRAIPGRLRRLISPKAAKPLTRIQRMIARENPQNEQA